MATKMLPRPKPQQKELKDTDPKARVQAEVLLATMARWIARQHVKEQNQQKVWDAVGLANATTAYLIEHRSRLRTEAKLILSSNEEEL
jgi:hypothetical protein